MMMIMMTMTRMMIMMMMTRTMMIMMTMIMTTMMMTTMVMTVLLLSAVVGPLNIPFKSQHENRHFRLRHNPSSVVTLKVAHIVIDS
jgi:hypothetical protein